MWVTGRRAPDVALWRSSRNGMTLVSVAGPKAGEHSPGRVRQIQMRTRHLEPLSNMVWTRQDVMGYDEEGGEKNSDAATIVKIYDLKSKFDKVGIAEATVCKYADWLVYIVNNRVQAESSPLFGGCPIRSLSA